MARNFQRRHANSAARGFGVGVGGDEIDQSLKRIHGLIEKSSYRLAEKRKCVFVEKPCEGLQDTYVKVFGPKNRFGVFLKLCNSAIPGHVLLSSLMAAWLTINVFERHVPWRLETGTGTVWSELSKLMEAEDIMPQVMLGKAQLRLLDDPVFKKDVLMVHAGSLRQSMILALLPHINESIAGDSEDLAWLWKDLEEIVEQSLVLKARMDVTPGLDFGWIWFQDGEILDAETMQPHYRVRARNRVGVTIMPGVVEGGTIIRKAEVVCRANDPLEQHKDGDHPCPRAGAFRSRSG